MKKDKKIQVYLNEMATSKARDKLMEMKAGDFGMLVDVMVHVDWAQ